MAKGDYPRVVSKQRRLTKSVALGISGALQASGFVLGVVGTRRLVRLRRRVRVAGMATATGAHGGLSLRF